MAKILFLVSIMLLSSYLTEQAKLSHDNMIDKSDIETNTLKEKLSGSASGRPDLCKMSDLDHKFCIEYGEPCDIYTSICTNNIHYSKESNSPIFIQHNFTLDNEWKTVGKPIYCRQSICRTEYISNIFKSTQIEYGNDTFTSLTVAYSESLLKIITEAVSAGFSTILKQPGGSINSFKQYDSEFEVKYENGFTVSYSTSEANAVSSGKYKLTCTGYQNQKIFIQMQTYMIRLRGNVCVYYRYSETFKKHVFKCNYVDLKMYPVQNQKYIVLRKARCNNEKINS